MIATGRQESEHRFIELAPLELGLGALTWEGTSVQETGLRTTGEVVVRIDPHYFRPAGVETLLGDPSMAHEKLGWTPTTTLRLNGFNVEGAMESPPTNTSAVAAAGAKG